MLKFLLKASNEENFPIIEKAGIIQIWNPLTLDWKFKFNAKLIKALKLLNERHNNYENFR